MLPQYYALYYINILQDFFEYSKVVVSEFCGNFCFVYKVNILKQYNIYTALQQDICTTYCQGKNPLHY